MTCFLVPKSQILKQTMEYIWNIYSERVPRLWIPAVDIPYMEAIYFIYSAEYFLLIETI